MEDGKIVVTGDSDNKLYLAKFLAMNAEYMTYLNDEMLFPKVKPVRNVTQYMPKKEQPRNERCNCGSGLKYKKCCGR